MKKSTLIDLIPTGSTKKPSSLCKFPLKPQALINPMKGPRTSILSQHDSDNPENQENEGQVKRDDQLLASIAKQAITGDIEDIIINKGDFGIKAALTSLGGDQRFSR